MTKRRRPLAVLHFWAAVVQMKRPVHVIVASDLAAAEEHRRFVEVSVRLAVVGDSYLVDPASCHMLVSKIKPCKSKYKPKYGETANGSLNHT